MKKTLFNIFFLVLGVALLWLAFKEQNFTLIAQELRKVNYSWSIPVLGVSLLGQASRAMRWKLLLDPLKIDQNKPVSVVNVWWALMFGYFVNLGVPRLGEVSRCVAVRRSENIGFEATVGTVVAERAIDVFCLFLLVVFTFFFQFDIAADFLRQYIFAPLEQSLRQKQNVLYILAAAGGCFLLLLGLLWRVLIKRRWFLKIRKFMVEVLKGLMSIRYMRRPWAFLGHTLFIWFCYFLMTYCWFFSMPATQSLGIQGGLFLLVLGSIGKSVPIQGGGMGAYHFLVTKGLSLSPFLIAATPALTLATVIHLTQVLFSLLVGAIAAVVVLYQNRWQR
ncbi:lysylphosphatidylglycerol synthase transmembrane domain-containing protein [Microscilla marina]|uniref:Membrane protein, putative n=1 Tax=Microscilla marina ATCC 23134 TaxID=313606 RepID=A1ZSC9_MICM2|nr:lysylphosphatidylglycerol synthase transmembrane domain-containing protein [Microscilla marina]EAY26677.1 membrane protein, putative [Microscilla marina ATCC 23134]